MIAGVDEAGRGALAGNVVASAVILDASVRIDGLKDSKLLCPAQRARLFTLITQKACAWSVGVASATEIDRYNILQATLLAMQRAIAALPIPPSQVWVDGIHAPVCDCSVHTLIGGDRLIPAISAASIIAKVVRDQQMQHVDKQFPLYGFAQHKGYPTVAHRRAITLFGPTHVHRHSFRPVAEARMASV